MRDEWVILHGGALGDLILTLQTVLSSADLCDARVVYVVSRIDHRPLTGVSVSLEWRSPDAIHTHWLFRDDDAAAPPRLAELMAGRRVVNFLDAPESRVHNRILELAPAFLASLDPRPRFGDLRHITEQWKETLACQGVHFHPTPWGTGLRPVFSQAGLPRKSPFGDRSPTRVLIHPGGGGIPKHWPLDRFIEVARSLIARGDCVRFALGPVESERFPEWHRTLTEVAPIADCSTLASLASWLPDATHFIGNDSGPGHVAAALGVATITLFGPTRAAVWHPLGSEPRTFQGDSNLPDWGVAVAAVVSALRN